MRRREPNRASGPCLQRRLLLPGLLRSVPRGFDATFLHHAARGKRVLALAYKALAFDVPPLPSALRDVPRATAESGLTFAGAPTAPLPHARRKPTAARTLSPFARPQASSFSTARASPSLRRSCARSATRLTCCR